MTRSSTLLRFFFFFFSLLRFAALFSPSPHLLQNVTSSPSAFRSLRHFFAVCVSQRTQRDAFEEMQGAEEELNTRAENWNTPLSLPYTPYIPPNAPRDNNLRELV